MRAFTQLALNAITSLGKSWAKSDPELALAELKRIRDAATAAIDEVSEVVHERMAAEAMANEGAQIHPDLVERLR